MGRAFICYRRGDVAGHAGRVFDRVARALGRDRVFMDVAGVTPGADFLREIDGSCSEPT